MPAALSFESEEKPGGWIFLSPIGPLVGRTSDDFEKQLRSYMIQTAVKAIAIDMTRVTDVDEHGWDKVIKIHTEFKKETKLLNVRSDLRIIRMIEHLGIEVCRIVEDEQCA
jgi:anti-anti-sigma regulatory factor